MVQYEELLASSARQLALSFEKIAASQVELRAAIGRQHEQCSKMSGQLPRYPSCY
jgi:hypothetical protein